MTADQIKATLDSLSKRDHIRIKAIQSNMRGHMKRGLSAPDALAKVRGVADYAKGRLGELALAKIESDYPAEGWEGER